MKVPPPRRNYAQMVRVVRNEQQGLYKNPVPYLLGKAYGTQDAQPAATRIRSLDELGINTRPPNQLQAPALEANYTTRESTALYAELPDDQQQYFDGSNPNPAPTRLDAKPGTKTRVYLNSNATGEKIDVSVHETTPTTALSQNTQQTAQAQKRISGSLHKSSTHLDTGLPHQPQAHKQTPLPIVKAPSLKGTAATALSFSLKL